MADNHWLELKRLFSELSDLPEEQQSVRLSELDKTEPELASELADLLRVHQQPATSFTRAVSSATTDLEAQAHQERVGKRFGAYQITEHIARGGMGDVYEAERTDGAFEQRVAIKLISSHNKSDQEELRFHAERQILAQLDHPGIARILDGGNSEDGTAFLVMEFVEGESIDAYCERHQLNLDARLRLFIKACDAVQFAHQNLIVHRDIKPSNILVTEDGQPKLLDFGIAKPIDPDSSGDVTELAARAMTPDYASPEQVLGQPITTRSDVYSLGVLLYELTTGRRPYSTAGMRASERESVICETDPSRPSVSAQQTQADNLSTHAFDIEPASLRGDIDEIVMAALRKQPDERYVSAQAFADDIARYLAGEPVSVRGGHWAYVLRKFVRRHALSVAAAATLVVGAVAALGYHTDTVTKERDRAQVEARKAKAVSLFMTEIFAAPNPDNEGASVSARDVVDAGRQRLETELTDQPEIRAELLSTLGDVYASLGEYDRSLAQHTEAQALHESLSNSSGVIRNLKGLGQAYVGLRKHDEGIANLEQAISLERRQNPEGSRELVDLLTTLGEALLSNDNIMESQTQVRAALELHEDLGMLKDEQYGSTLVLLGDVLQRLGDYGEAEQVARNALDVFSSRSALPSASRLDALQILSVALVQLNRLDEAETLFLEILDVEAKVYGADHPALDNNMVQLGRLYRKALKIDQAELWIRRAVDHSTRTRGRKTFDTGYDLQELGMIMERKGDVDAADSAYQEALDIYTEVLDQNNSYISPLAAAYAVFLTRNDQPERALPLAERALRVANAALPEGHWLQANALAAVGLAQQALGNNEAAAVTLAEAFKELSESRPGVGNTIYAGEKLVDVYVALGRDAEADSIRLAVDEQKEK
ncbi:MAG: tetratricopeptide repeat protein [Gammaproteobacteria bacterium]